MFHATPQRRHVLLFRIFHLFSISGSTQALPVREIMGKTQVTDAYFYGFRLRLHPSRHDERTDQGKYHSQLFYQDVFLSIYYRFHATPLRRYEICLLVFQTINHAFRVCLRRFPSKLITFFFRCAVAPSRETCISRYAAT